MIEPEMRWSAFKLCLLCFQLQAAPLRHGQFLVMEANGVKGKRASMPFTYPFKLKTWVNIAIEYSPARNHEVRLYVVGSDGHLTITLRLDSPVNSRNEGLNRRR